MTFWASAAEELGIVRVRLQNGKFVTTEPSEDVGLADQLRQARHDRTQQQIAHGMAEHIIDILESVKIDEVHGKNISAAPAGGKGNIEPLLKHTSDGE